MWGLHPPARRPRPPLLGRVAACLALLGALGHAALSMLYLVWIQVPKGEADQAAMIALLDRITNAATTGIVVPLFIAFPLAFLALYGSYVRARIASRWILVPVVAAPLCAALAPGRRRREDLGRADLPADRRGRRRDRHPLGLAPEHGGREGRLC